MPSCLCHNSTVRNARKPNPLRVDPTRTGTIRRQFTAELNRRFTRLKRAMLKLIVEDDALGIGPRLAFNVTDNAGLFDPDSSFKKVEAFRKWLRSQIALDIIEDRIADLSDQWFVRYVQDGYAKGAGRAFDDARKPYAKGYAEDDSTRGFYRGTKEEFLRSSFARPVAVEKVKLLAGRVFTELKGVTESMSTKLTRTLADGLVQGQSPRDIGRTIAKVVDGIDRTRADVIARTEIIRCHAEGQLDALEEMGVEEVGVMVEWLTAGDEKVCEECSSLETVVLTIEEARGMLPRHPRCRCAWTPANVGEPKKGQTREPRDIRESIKESLMARAPAKRTLAEQRDRSNWSGAGVTIDDDRPESILDAK